MIFTFEEMVDGVGTMVVGILLVLTVPVWIVPWLVYKYVAEGR